MTEITSLDGTPASRAAFGTMQFGGRADAHASRAMYDASRAAGITHFDTAYVYNDGRSEELLGGMLADDRDGLIIATKADFTKGGSADNIARSCEVSLERMNLDVIDLFYLHRFDDETPLEESFEALAKLKEAGKIRYIGVSNFAAWQVVKARWVAAQFGVKVDVLQPMYNLVKRQAEVEILPMCADQGVACVPYSPLGGGLLTGKYVDGGDGRLVEDRMYTKRYGRDWMHETANALADMADEEAVDPATLAVAWVARHPSGPMPIVSARSAQQLAPSLDALRFDMPDDLYARISALSPAPPPATDRLEEQE